LDDDDRGFFLHTLSQACEMSGWRVHAWVLMRNHYHLFLRTPEPKLVAGMSWLQSTLTRRSNVRHRQWGRVFGDRYKAVVVQGEDTIARRSIFAHWPCFCPPDLDFPRRCGGRLPTSGAGDVHLPSPRLLVAESGDKSPQSRGCAAGAMWQTGKELGAEFWPQRPLDAELLWRGPEPGCSFGRFQLAPQQAGNHAP
jgi:hypothetical protein